jgi:hypothetical protein
VGVLHLYQLKTLDLETIAIVVYATANKGQRPTSEQDRRSKCPMARKVAVHCVHCVQYILIHDLLITTSMVVRDI